MTRTSQYLRDAGAELGANADELPRAASAATPRPPHASGMVLGDISAIGLALEKPLREAQAGELTPAAVVKKVTHLAPPRDIRAVDRRTVKGTVNHKRRNLPHVGVTAGGSQLGALGALPPVAEAAAGAHQSWLESDSAELFHFIGARGSSVDKKVFDCPVPPRQSPEEVRHMQDKPPQVPMLLLCVTAAETSGEAWAKFPERTRHRPGG